MTPKQIDAALTLLTGKELPFHRCLNAMHQADNYVSRNVMNSDQWEQYGRQLERIHPTAVLKSAADDKPDYYDFTDLMCGLSAAQRAEALVRTLNLWTE